MSMKKITVFFAVASALLLSGCKTVENLKANIADIQTKNLTKKMPDGTLLHYNINVIPTAAWGCTPVGTTQSYDWHDVEMKGQFHLGGEYDWLLTTGIKYLQNNRLRANYANLGIPDTSTDSIGFMTFERNKNPIARTTFYQCKKINPNRQMGRTETEHTSFDIY